MSTFTPTTWNPADKDSSVTLSNSNKTAASGFGSVRSIFGAESGKWYWECTITAGGSSQIVGVGTAFAPLNNYPGADAKAWGYEKSSGSVHNDGNIVDTTTSGASNLGVMLDLDAKTLRFRRNGTVIGTGDITIAGEKFYAMFGYGSTCVANFGASAFAYSVPSGYQSGFGLTTYQISGNVKDDTGSNAARVVRAYQRSSGKLGGSTTSNAGSGNYTLTTVYPGEHTVVFLDNDAGTAYNALVLDRVPVN